MDSEQNSPPEQLTVDGDRLRIRLRRSLYPLDAIYGAAYLFIDRCFVLLDAPDEESIEVVLRGREALTTAALEILGGEFANELLSETWRARVTENNRPLIEAVTARAMAGALGPSEEEHLELGGDTTQREPGDDEAFASDAFDDPLGIAVPWEEKYGKQSEGSEKDGG